jgi:hypothetical protein
MDPGPTPGLVCLTYSQVALVSVRVVQASANCALDVLQMWFESLPAVAEVYFQAELFVVGTKSFRAGSPGARTRDMVGSAVTLAGTHNVHTELRNAAAAKAWAKDERLEKAGLLGHLVGMKHAKDAARHALYTACHEGNIPDPFSKKARRTDA